MLRNRLLGATALCFAVGAVFYGGPAKAVSGYGMTGNDLFGICGPVPSAAGTASNMCIGYVIGVFETIDWLKVGHYCAPQFATNEQLADIVAKFLAAYPERRGASAPIIISVAIEDAFPCPTR